MTGAVGLLRCMCRCCKAGTSSGVGRARQLMRARVRVAVVGPPPLSECGTCILRCC